MKKRKLGVQTGFLLTTILLFNVGCNERSHSMRGLEKKLEKVEPSKIGESKAKDQKLTFEYDTKYEHDFENDEVIGKFYNTHLQKILRRIKGKSKGEIGDLINDPDGTVAIVNRVYNNTALHLACNFGKSANSINSEDLEKGVYRNLVVYLLNKGANVYVRNQDTYTPLHFAIRNGEYDVVKMLLEAGADPNAIAKGIVTGRIQSPWNMTQDTRIRELLQAHGAQPVAPSSSCCTIL